MSWNLNAVENWQDVAGGLPDLTVASQFGTSSLNGSGEAQPAADGMLTLMGSCGQGPSDLIY